MQKIKKTIVKKIILNLVFAFLLGVLVFIYTPKNVYAQEIEDEDENLDYIWLEEEIENAKKEQRFTIYSKCAVVFDRTSKTTLWGKDENKKVPMASTTKIMTAVVMLENIENLDEKVEVCRQAASIGGSRLGLKTGDMISYNDLLYGLMLCSGNDAAMQIAISVAGSIEEFSNLMNKKAKELGLTNTNFITPHGLDDENHYTTALELAIITDYALNIEKFLQVVSTKEYNVTINGYLKTINNTNELLGYLEGVNGVKTGFTNNAGRCLVTSVKRNEFNIITVVLGADTKKIRTQDSIKLIEYTYNNYELIDLKTLVEEYFTNWKQINEKRIKVYKGQKQYISTEMGRLKYEKYPVLKEEMGNIFIDIDTCFMLNAPIEPKTKIGEIKIFINTTEITKISILTKEKIEKKNYLFFLKDLLSIYQFNMIY